MPMMPFIGVRISWLTVARKAFAWLANSARSRASSAPSRRACAEVMSRAIAWWETCAGFVAHRELDPGEPANVASACGTHVGRGQALADGDGGSVHDAHIDAEVGERSAGESAARAR